MSDDEIIDALVRYWPETVPSLRPQDVAAIREAAARIQAEPRDERLARAALADLLAVLAARLPRGHVVRDVMSRSARLRPGAVTDWERIAGAFGRLPELQDPDAWLLAAPALSEQQVRANGCDPDGGDLIRLGAGRDARFPAFQFGPDGQPLPVVAEVNRLLDAASDPWGVADWWLGRNAWLAAVPAGLLGRAGDERLVLAARAELTE